MASRQPSKRRRKSPNTVVSAVSDPDIDGRTIPRLPKRVDGEQWAKPVRQWWRSLWSSDLAEQFFHETDELTVKMLADLMHRRLRATSVSEAIRLSAEVRSMQTHLGLSPRARLAAKIELDRSEVADRHRRTRRNTAVVTDVETPAARGETLDRAEMLRRVREMT